MTKSQNLNNYYICGMSMGVHYIILIFSMYKKLFNKKMFNFFDFSLSVQPISQDLSNLMP